MGGRVVMEGTWMALKKSGTDQNRFESEIERERRDVPMFGPGELVGDRICMGWTYLLVG
jgi:hypothetical protein